MTTIKCEIDLEDFVHIEDGSNLEKIVSQALTNSVYDEIQRKYEYLFKETSNRIALEVVKQIEEKLQNLINEDVAITDKWGRPIFIGSVEDYIKKMIDDRLLKPVDSEGRPISDSCSTVKTSWIEWYIEYKIKQELAGVDRRIKSMERVAERLVDEKIKAFKSAGLNELIVKRLKAAGVE